MEDDKSEYPAKPNQKVFFGNSTVNASEKTPLVSALFESIAGKYDLMNDLMSLGIHRRWKNAMVANLNPHPSINMVDVAGGTGDIAFRVWEKISQSNKSMNNCKITVCDLTPGMVIHGRDRALDRGIIDGIGFIAANGEDLPIASSSQDAVTNAFGMRNITNLNKSLLEVKRVLKRGGRFLCLEFGGPVRPEISLLYDSYTKKLLPKIGQVITGEGDAYRYLHESINKFPERNTVAKWIEDSGLSRVKTKTYSGGIVTLYSAWRL